MESKIKIKIYSGLTLKARDIQSILPTATVSGPVKRGDVLKDIENGFHLIGIIDGVFYQEPAVSPSEIMDALRVGVKVFGSSSMGALRAAELSSHGMIGVGRVFKHIKQSPNFEDDFLGQLFIPGEDSESCPSLIEIQFAIDDLYMRKQLTHAQKKALIYLFKKYHFSDRDFGKIGPDSIAKKILKNARFKKSDGLEMLSEIKRHLRSVRDFNLHNVDKHQSTGRF